MLWGPTHNWLRSHRFTVSKDSATCWAHAGKNHAGVCRFKLTGKAGDKIVMRYGELLEADGKTLNPTRKSFATCAVTGAV